MASLLERTRGLYCTMWDGQHKCNHKYRLVNITEYESSIDLYQGNTLIGNFRNLARVLGKIAEQEKL